MIETSHINPALTKFGDQFTQREPDSITVEESDLLYGLVRMCKPHLALETGTGHAIATKRIGQALRANRKGFLISCDTDPDYAQSAIDSVRKLPVDIRCTTGLRTLESFSGVKLQFALIDAGSVTNRMEEVATIVEREILEHGGLLVLHDAGNPKYRVLPDYVRKRGWPGMVLESLAGMGVFKRP